MSRKLVKVKNTSHDLVNRGGRVFPPLTTTEVKVSDYQLREISACVHLQVKQVETQGVKPCDDLKGQLKTQGFEPINTEKGEFDCPYCEEYQGKSRQGLMAHVRQAHEELYEEFKERG